MGEKKPKHLTQCRGIRESKSVIQDAQKRKEDRHSLRYYEELMKHDAHCKVGGRIRQRGWGR
ncbi:MAG TPA: hypothetical protein VGE40_00820 [Bacilli bacterium]